MKVAFFGLKMIRGTHSGVKHEFWLTGVVAGAILVSVVANVELIVYLTLTYPTV